MDELHNRLAAILDENTSLKRKVADMQHTIDSQQHELLTARKSRDTSAHLKRIAELEQENTRLISMHCCKHSQCNQNVENINHMAQEGKNAIKSSPGTECRIEPAAHKHDEPDELRRYLRIIREYVTGLTGYKMEFKDGEIIFHSLYAFNTEDVFIFRYKSGSMELVNNEFAGAWNAEIQNYLITGKSIPAFLAAVTLELFNKKTFG
ncbi:putative mitotic checkpoint protein [Ordospora pajunii]|uniref:putative mitotic checkpoint protein n=1 Tax=Ordospora pajunii TaxID=3039483 RepID=UPI002952888F|nr:putative mitotic checkpoint protein [Ordospora pajunii]KAH9411936.1 putative mitotic checkpoint protein [Ordospora pajunii]